MREIKKEVLEEPPPFEMTGYQIYHLKEEDVEEKCKVDGEAKDMQEKPQPEGQQVYVVKQEYIEDCHGLEDEAVAKGIFGRLQPSGTEGYGICMQAVSQDNVEESCGVDYMREHPKLSETEEYQIVVKEEEVEDASEENDKAEKQISSSEQDGNPSLQKVRIGSNWQLLRDVNMRDEMRVGKPMSKTSKWDERRPKPRAESQILRQGSSITPVPISGLQVNAEFRTKADSSPRGSSCLVDNSAFRPVTNSSCGSQQRQDAKEDAMTFQRSYDECGEMNGSEQSTSDMHEPQQSLQCPDHDKLVGKPMSKTSKWDEGRPKPRAKSQIFRQESSITPVPISGLQVNAEFRIKADSSPRGSSCLVDNSAFRPTPTRSCGSLQHQEAKEDAVTFQSSYHKCGEMNLREQSDSDMHKRRLSLQCPDHDELGTAKSDCIKSFLIQCPDGNEGFASKLKLLYHIRTHPRDNHKCTECNKGFTNKETLARHITVHTGEKPYQCSHCKKGFAFNRALTQHIRTHTGEKPYQCTDCEKGFSTKKGLTLHIRTHTGEKPYSCSDCEKGFASKTDLSRHIRTHTGEKPYLCSDCKKKFGSKTELKHHIRTHTGEKPYSCSDCKMKFGRRAELTRHIRTHSGEKPYSCSYCEKPFSTKTALTLHIRTHTGEKPYSCSYCEKGFSTQSHLILHIRTHTGEKPYSCSYCEKGFSTKSPLILHIRVHTGEKPYSCSDCKKEFASKGDLSRHIRTHTGEKPYSCSDCKKKFGSKAELKRHIKVHDREKPYSCSHCKKEFGGKRDLAQHDIRIQTGEKLHQCFDL